MKCNECGNVGPCPQCEPDKFAGCADEFVPREVADRLAELLGAILTAEHTIEMGGWMDNYEQVAKARARKANAIEGAKIELAEYRKAVKS